MTATKKAWIKAFLHAVVVIGGASVFIGLIGLLAYGIQRHTNTTLVVLAICTVAAITCLFKYEIGRGNGLW
jgi:hypothetical protein